MHILARISAAVVLIGSSWGLAAEAIVTDPSPGPAARHGIVSVEAALRERRLPELLVVGLAKGDGPAAKLLREVGVTAPETPEAVVIRKAKLGDKPAWVIAGSDDRGVMYAALDVADRIGWARGEAPLSELRETTETPFAPERAMSIYTMNRAYWESRFYDEAYWARYLDTLARNRFDSLVIIFGYENGGFLAPAYPYFFDVEGFPDVRMVGITPPQQARNLQALRKLIEMAHARGVRLSVGLWDHIYRGGVQGGGIPNADRGMREPTEHLVWGVNEKNLVPYTQAALAKLVKLVPDLDGIQFRMHDESGLKVGEQEAFWRDVFRQMKQAAPHLRLDLRAKGLPDSVIESAIEVGVPFRITTKYWMEQMGMPFNPTHINRQNQQDRRHSYADMLRYPQRYRMHWRLWNGGTSRVLLWGDPDYARRFAASTKLYDGDGFEVNEPLCTKMEAQPHDMKPFELLRAPYRSYDYEFERYWHFFQVFGRLGYNPDTPAEVWGREFARRFGEAGPAVEKGLHRASQVLPRIVGACYPYGYFPMTRGWPEKQRLGDLPYYARAEGSDIQQFASFDEEAQLLIEGGETAKMRPTRTSRWFEQVAADILAQVAEAEKRIGGRRGPEFEATMVDLRIHAGLALFHARRIPAAVSYRLYERTKDGALLDEAIGHERKAVEAWRQLVAAAGDAYADDLMFGVRGAGLCGHWRDELVALEKGLVALEEQRKKLPAENGEKKSPRYRPLPAEGDVMPPEVMHQAVTDAPAGKALTIWAQASDPSGVRWVRLRYRNVNQRDDYRTLDMVLQNGRHEATIPADHVGGAWDLMYFIEAMDGRGNGGIYPDLEKGMPYVVVRLRR